jgi:hypothetical protein
MHKSSKAPTIMTILTLSLLFLVFPQNASAYIDLGTGSYIFQIILAFLIGGLYAIKQHFQRVKTFVKKLFSIKDVSSNK